MPGKGTLKLEETAWGAGGGGDGPPRISSLGLAAFIAAGCGEATAQVGEPAVGCGYSIGLSWDV